MFVQSEPGPQLSMFNLMFKGGGNPMISPAVPESSQSVNQFSNLRRLQVLPDNIEADVLKKTAKLSLQNEGPFSNIMLVKNDHFGMQY